VWWGSGSHGDGRGDDRLLSYCVVRHASLKRQSVSVRGLHSPGPGCRASAGPDPARFPGLSLTAHIMFGFGPGSNDSSQYVYGTFVALSSYSVFAKKNA
jgi:hypothetical protein